MSTKICKVKNISNGVFVLALDEVEKGKRFKMRPNSEVAITEDELNYLNNECSGAFALGYLEIVDLNEDSGVDAPETHNKLTDEDMEDMLNAPFMKFKSQVGKIEVSHVLKDLRMKAEEMNKSNKIIEIIDARIEQVADSLVL